MSEIKQIPESVINKLNEPLPKEAITQHPTKPYLSSIKAIYVTERFTRAFGLGGWTFKSKVVEKGQKGMVVVKVRFKVPKYGIYYESYGGNDNGGEGSKNFDLGDAYKGATTDALTKIGSFLGVGIDVFKGKNDKPKDNYKEDNRPWLDEKGFNYLMEKGTLDQINEAFKTRRMKKDYRKQLENKLKQ